MKSTRAFIVVAALCVIPVVAQDSRPYTEGPVTEVTFVRVKPGQFDEYMKHLGGPYRKEMEAYQKAGLVSGYRAFSITPRTASDPNIILSVTYPNMATLDKSKEFDAIGAQVLGSFAAQNKGYADRGAMREILGGALMREVIPK